MTPKSEQGYLIYIFSFYFQLKILGDCRYTIPNRLFRKVYVTGLVSKLLTGF